MELKDQEFKCSDETCEAEYHCNNCGAVNPDLHELDYGIGSYEFWGARGVQHYYVWVTKCCEGEPITCSGDVYEYEPPERDYGV